MAVLCLSKDLDDMKFRVGRIVIGENMDGNPVSVNDLKAAGAVTMLLKDAIKPNLVQTLENSPVLIHGGPFANIAHGCNSIIATSFASRAADYVVTEAGFGADLGMEKFIDIKARNMGTMPAAVVIVASIRALKSHGGVEKTQLKIENIDALARGIENLAKHTENVQQYHLPYVIALNRFESDSSAELNYVMNWAKINNHPLALSEVFGKGSLGGIELAETVIKLTNIPVDSASTQLYRLDESIKTKIEKIAKIIYGAKEVVYSEKALDQINSFNRLGWDNLAICMAKTPLSLTDNPKIIGRPRDFTITIREFKPSIGAGFLVALTGEVMTMPGLPKIGAYENMDVIDGKIVGLF
jgi:formate--tetrahydrofolate ligase